MQRGTVLPIIAGAAVGLLTGTLSGLLGIGGGVIMVPVLHLAFSKPMQIAVGTSLAAMVLGALAGAVRHASYGNIDWLVALGLALGTVTGAYCIGAPLCEALPSATLRKIFGVVMCLFGLRMILR